MKTIVLLSMLFCTSQFAQASFSTMDTADLLKEDESRLGIETQLGLNSGRGFNAIGRYDMGVSRDAGLRFLLGTGSTPIQAGGFFKMVPFPDVGRQPGIGAFAGVILTSKDGETGLHFRFHPLISKKLEARDAGTFTPYLSIPFGISSVAGKSSTPVNFELGTSWSPQNSKILTFWGEVGAELSSSYSYVSAGLTVPLDALASR